MRGHTLAVALAITVPVALVHADDDDAAQPAKPKKKFARHHDDEDADADQGSDAKPPAPPPAPPPPAADEDDSSGAMTGTEETQPKKKKKKKQSTPAPATDAGMAHTSATTTASTDASVSAQVTPGSPAHDIAPTRVRFSGELLGAGPLDSVNRAEFGVGGGVGLGATIFLVEALDAHVGAELVYLSGSKGMSSTTNVVGMVGPRVHLAQFIYGHPTHHDAWLDAHFRFGESGGIARPGFDVGGAFQWELSPALRLGPVVRYEFGSDPRDKNAQLFTVGVAIGFGGRTRIPTHVDGDRDGDGIADAVDQCPDQPAGKFPDPNKLGCPSDDRDGDGIRDADDLCPDEPVGKHPDPNRRGCPFHDRDGDGIADEDDKCPDQPGPPNPFEPSKNGCPVLAKVVNNKIEILQEIFFELDSATIKSESFPVLQAVADILKNRLPDARVRVEGHTDKQGSDEYNLDLSKRRARAVAQWLITNGGIESKRLETEGYGSTRPKVSGPNADLSQNRRVEFVILDN